jgi:protein TonB
MSGFSPSLSHAAGLNGHPLGTLAETTPPALMLQAQGEPAPVAINPENPWALVVVVALHVLLLGGLAHHWSQARVTVVPPAVVGMLVTAPPVVEPVPLPMVAQPQPVPRPVMRRQPVPPAPVAAPSERAITAPPPEPVAPVAVDPAPVQAPPAPPAVAAPEPKAVPEPVVPPRSDAAHLNNPAPAYPPISRRLGEQGRVQLDVYILADGSVGEVKLKRSSGYPRLDQAALEAVRQWRYQPARRGSEAIPFWYVQPLTFSQDG